MVVRPLKGGRRQAGRLISINVAVTEGQHKQVPLILPTQVN
jgi:hypothetical protein